MYHYVLMLHGDKVRDCQDYRMAERLCKKIKGSKIVALTEAGMPAAKAIKNKNYTDLRYKPYQEV